MHSRYSKSLNRFQKLDWRNIYYTGYQFENFSPLISTFQYIIWNITQVNLIFKGALKKCLIFIVQPPKMGWCYPQNIKWKGGQLAHYFQRCSIFFPTLPKFINFWWTFSENFTRISVELVRKWGITLPNFH